MCSAASVASALGKRCEISRLAAENEERERKKGKKKGASRRKDPNPDPALPNLVTALVRANHCNDCAIWEDRRHSAPCLHAKEPLSPRGVKANSAKWVFKWLDEPQSVCRLPTARAGISHCMCQGSRAEGGGRGAPPHPGLAGRRSRDVSERKFRVHH